MEGRSSSSYCCYYYRPGNGTLRSKLYNGITPQRVCLGVYENQTNIIDRYGTTPHSAGCT